MMNSGILKIFSLIGLAGATTACGGDVDFRRDIRPILSNKCYACHGPDAGQRQAGLRFDTAEGAAVDLGGYQAISPGHPDESELVRRILSDDPDERMPPAEHPKQLTSDEKLLLTEWISQGAVWSEHWAYLPARKRAVPRPKDNHWPVNFIDNFILDHLQGHSLGPSPEADRTTLLRRLNFDLIGLPPTPQEVAEFRADRSVDAVERVVDRLLQSPHFGERLAVYWLDLVRYADTVGYHGDQDVSISPFRDYVINAFNRNMPFDQFTREQLAGDLLDKPTQEQMVASGYNRLGMMSAEGGVQPEEYLAKYAADRVRNASTVWLGSTLGCAECHDHKFDPFSARDFYQMAAFFADIKERGLYSGANSDGNWGPQIAVADLHLPELLAPLDTQIAAIQNVLDTPTQQLRDAQSEWELEQRDNLSTWRSLKPQTGSATGGAKLQIAEDGSILAEGESPNQTTYRLSSTLPDGLLAGICLQVLPHDKLPAKGPGRADNGNFVVTEVKAYLQTPNGARTRLALTRASASVEQAADEKNPYGKWSAAAAIDQDDKGKSWGWAILPAVGQANHLVLAPAQPAMVREQSLVVEIEQNHDNPKHTLGHFRLWITSLEDVEELSGPTSLSAELQAIVRSDVLSRSPEQLNQLAGYFRSITPLLDEVRAELASVNKNRAELVEKHTRTSLVTESVEPREIRVLKRGNWMDKSGEIAAPDVPQFLGQLALAVNDATPRPSRLDLANWIASPQNPLTARVLVNRLWKIYFGAGLSPILDDFGAQGEAPTHPELLDNLAVEFVESGWDIKHMVKLMVMSSVYRQSSLMREELEHIDPQNRLLARQSRFRLDAELVRDNALAIAGLLVRDVGGRSAKPYQPAGLYQHLNFPAREYQADSDANQYRRGVYTHWQRQFLHPALQAMDAPTREECTAQRPRSNTPLAALVLLNDPSYVEASRNLAQLALEHAEPSTNARSQWIARRALSREFTERELEVVTELLDKQLAQYSDAPAEARALIGIGLSPPRDRGAPAELAAWTSVARVVLNMHEVRTRN